MHDLRAAVYRHLQRMSLAFFTRTRTGEVQSRIANDIGGIDSVVTTTATSIAQNATTVIATLVAMVLLDWRLAAISLVFVPPFVWLTRRVGQVRRQITTERQRRLADLSALVSESLSVSGIMLGKTMGRGRDLADRFTTESREIADIEVRSRMAGRWLMSTIQMVFAIQPALVYWIAGQSFVHGSTAISIGTVVAFTQLQTRLLFPIQSLLSTGADVEASLALFDRIFEYLDLPVDIVEAEHPVQLRPRRCSARSASTASRSATREPTRDAPWTLHDIDLVVPAGTRTAIVGETGAGKTTLGYLVARLYEPQDGRVTIDGVDVRDASLESLAATVGVVSQETYLFHASVRENLRFARPDATDEEIEDAARTARITRPDRSRCPRATTRSSASAATASPAARSSAWRSRARSCATRRCSSSTRRRARSTPRPRPRYRPSSSGSPRAARRSRSRTGSRPCATPTRSSSSTAAGSSSAARTRSCSSAAGCTRRSSPGT